MRISDWSSDVCSSDLSGGSPSHMRRCCSSAASASSSSVIGRYPIPLQAGQVGPKGHSLVRIKPWPSHWRHSVSGVSSIMPTPPQPRSEEHTSELQSLMRISYAVFCLKKKTQKQKDDKKVIKKKQQNQCAIEANLLHMTP